MSLLLEPFLDKLSNLAVIASLSAEIEFINSSASSILGYKKEELLGSEWWIKTSPFGYPGHKDKNVLINQIRRGRTKFQAERKLATADGEWKYILWDISVTEGKIVAIGADLTQTRNESKKLNKKVAELSERTTAFSESMEYARHIQSAILPSRNLFEECFDQHLVYYKPKDIVSGDLYWLCKFNGIIFFAAIDCTGHGVPGAMLSVLAGTVLKDAVTKEKLEEPGKILQYLDVEITSILNQNEPDEIQADGMDIILCALNKESGELLFSGANRPLWIRREEKLIELKTQRFPIGYFFDIEKEFVSESFQVKQGDRLYLFSDGLADQFGGESEKKFSRKRFRELIDFMSEFDLCEQESFLDYALKNWKQGYVQTDDILVMGVQI